MMSDWMIYALCWVVYTLGLIIGKTRKQNIEVLICSMCYIGMMMFVLILEKIPA